MTSIGLMLPDLRSPSFYDEGLASGQLGMTFGGRRTGGMHKAAKKFMNNRNKDLIKSRVQQWRKAAPVLQEVRDNDIRLADTARALKLFSGAVLASLPKNPPLPWSGLVEQQQSFRKLRAL
jgi:hypothetical protein